MNILDELKTNPPAVTDLMDAATTALRKARRWPVTFTWRGHECRANQTVFRALAEIKINGRWQHGACRWD